MVSPNVARLALLWLVVMGWPIHGAAAQSTSVRDARDEARASFEHGVSAARQGHWREAREAFKRSHQLVPSAITLLNLAGSQVNSGELVEGAATYRRILEAPADAADHVGEVERVLAALTARLPTLRFMPQAQAEGRDRLLVLDGKALELAEATQGVHLNPGTHRVELAQTGEPLVRHDFAIAEGQTLVLDLDQLCAACRAARAAQAREQAGQEPARGAAALVDPRAAPETQPRALGPGRTVAWAAFSVGAAGLVSFAVSGPMALLSDRDLARGCGERKVCGASEVQRADRLALAADVSLGVAVGGAVVGTVAWLVARKRSSKAHALHISPQVARTELGLLTQVSF